MTSGPRWTPEEEAALATDLRVEELAAKLGRTVNAVRTRRTELRAQGILPPMPQPKPWSDDDATLRRLFAEGKDDVEIAEALDRTLGAIKLRRLQLDLLRNREGPLQPNMHVPKIRMVFSPWEALPGGIKARTVSAAE